jgi:hypothetical protein
MTRVAVEFAWRAAGNLRLEADKPVFPVLDDVPGVYRFTFESPERPRRIYIGETDRLRRRAQHYRTPGPTQTTNLRMNEEIVVELRRGVPLSFAVITAASLAIDDASPVPMDLSRKTNRQIVENAAMAEVIAEREADLQGGPLLMNRPGVGEAEWR